MPQKIESQEIEIYRIKVTLAGSKPPIWRRIEVQSHASLYKLHKIIQIAMEWSECHLWEITVGKDVYSDPSCFDDDYGTPINDAKKMPLCDVLKNEKSKLIYNYDFGDSWEHKIVLEKICAPEIEVEYPRCIGGKLACPPEDCGGICGFYNMLECLNNPDDEEYESIRDWMGDDYDPEAFDIESVNRGLKSIKV